MTNKRKRGSAPPELTTESVAAMTDAEVIATAETLDAEDQAMDEANAKAAEDRALLAALEARTNGTALPESDRGTTVEDLYKSLVKWVRDAKQARPSLSEPTLIKILELTIGWTLQTRTSIPTSEYGGGVDEAPDLPEPTERITAAEEN